MSSDTIAITPTPTSGAFTPTSELPTSTTKWSNGNFGGIPPSMLQWVAVVVIISIVLCLLLSRYLFIKRFYDPSIRAFFIPPRGIHISILNIHIKGPKPRPSSPPSYFAATLNEASSRRRGRATRGTDIDADGRRGGNGDEDVLEPSGPIRRVGLPAYYVDRDLPGYDFIDNRQRNDNQEQGIYVETAESNYAAAISQSAREAETSSSYPSPGSTDPSTVVEEENKSMSRLLTTILPRPIPQAVLARSQKLERGGQDTETRQLDEMEKGEKSEGEPDRNNEQLEERASSSSPSRSPITS